MPVPTAVPGTYFAVPSRLAARFAAIARAMKKILIVEDNELNRDVLSRRLGSRGYQVSVASHGEEGLRLAQTERPDLILMDLGLPELDGWECTRRLKASPNTRTIPIIALTAHAMLGDRERALEAGCDDFDTKPINFSGLLAKMERLLQVAA